LFQAVGNFVDKMLTSFFFDFFGILVECPADVNAARSIVAGFFPAVAGGGVISILIKVAPGFSFLGKIFSRFDVVFQ
jgi:hypothetical protein